MGNLKELLDSLVAQINDLSQRLIDTQKAADDLALSEYNRGFEDGKNSVPQGDKIYSQAELDAAVAGAVEPLNTRIVELEAVVAGIDQRIADAVNAKVSEIKSKLDEVEAGF